jgi:hypothetical protein
VRMERNGMHLTNNLSDTTIAEGHLFLKVDWLMWQWTKYASGVCWRTWQHWG